MSSIRTDAVQRSTGSGQIAGPAEVPLWRLHLLRAGYFVVGVGLVVYVWPGLIQHDLSWPLWEGLTTCMLVAMSLLALLGLRYPLQMLPVLLFEVAWKLIWLATVVLPLWASHQMDPATWDKAVECFWVVVPLAVIPWRFVLTQYVRSPGARWRADPSRRATGESMASRR